MTACGNEPARGWYFASLPQAGLFRSEPLPAGDYVVYVQGPRVHPVVRRITLTEGEEATVDLELRAGRPTSLTIQLSEPPVQDGIVRGVVTVTEGGGVKILEEAFFENFANLTERLLHREFALLPGDYVVSVDDYDAKRIARVEVTVPPSADGTPFPIRVQ